MLSKMANKARKEWDLGIQPSSYKESINFIEYPIESGQGNYNESVFYLLMFGNNIPKV